ncbi:MAG TPA: hypothetical protein VFT37_04925 [Telluria sp.]|nr:hypothetical protein [Telluria sp.]
MKNLLLALAIFAGAAIPAAAQTSVSVTIGQPGFYGTIDIGDYGPPPVFIAEPIIVQREVRYVAQPIYLRVPPGHRKHWSRHCSRYNACGRPVYFVRDDWYLNEYAPRYQREHRARHVDYRRDGRYDGDRRDGRYDGDRREVRYDGDRRYDRVDHHDRDDRKHGKGHKDKDHGKGHGNGHGRGH